MTTMTRAIRRLVGADASTDSGPMEATWKGVTIARSDRTLVVEGNHYFPAADVDSTFLAASEKQTVCPWKGVASYYDVVVDGERNAGAAWYYPSPSPAAASVKDRIAFWRGVKVRRAAALGDS
ncbi:MAG TPA: DUF427 domain-containing protein [Chloroflexota bacterium]|nr:DUF427 domain-containing protein [Chloroflexota bacterium]